EPLTLIYQPTQVALLAGEDERGASREDERENHSSLLWALDRTSCPPDGNRRHYAAAGTAPQIQVLLRLHSRSISHFCRSLSCALAQLFRGVLPLLGLRRSQCGLRLCRHSRSLRRRFSRLPYPARSWHGAVQVGGAGDAACGRSRLDLHQLLCDGTLDASHYHLAKMCANHSGRDGSIPAFLRSL